MKWQSTILVFITLTAFNGEKNEHPVVPNDNFITGEKLEYKLNFGIFTVGKAQTKVYDQMYRVNGRECYRMDIVGRTSGLVDWIAQVDDTWGAYVDSVSLLPHISYRNISEGRYKRNEIVKFDHQTDMIEVKVLNQKTRKFKEPKYYKAPDNIRDILGGYLYFRTIDFSRLNPGDTVGLDAFFEDTFYDFKVVFVGKERIRTKAGRFNSIVLDPLMPKNDIFDGKSSVRIWISDDKNHIPLKARAKMFLGNASCELIDFQGLKHDLNTVERN